MGNPNIIEFVNHPSIIRYSALKLSEGLRPRRVVLRKLEGKYVTHYEYMTIRVHFRGKNGSDYDKEGYDVVTCEHESFDQGNYFDFGGYLPPEMTEPAAREKAIADFEIRSKNF